jgi:hypothetical protein
VIINSALSAEEIAAIYNADSAGKCRPCAAPPSGLVSWWGGDNDTLDMVGTNNGTLQGNATYAAGKVGQAFSFDGSGDYVSIPNDLSLNPTAAITVDAWVFSDNASYAPLIVKKAGSNSGYSLELSTDSSKVNFYVYIGSSWVGSPQANLPKGIWTHVAGVYDGSGVGLYVNGQFIGSTARTGAITPSASELNIGRDPSDPTRFFKGLIDEVEIFNRALSTSKIAAIYNAGSTGRCSPKSLTVSPSGTGSGSVTGNGLNCSWNGSSSSGTCSASLAHNTAVSLTASSGIGSAFSGRKGGTGSAAGYSGTGACAFNITQTSSIGSVFIEKSSIYLPKILRP